MKKKRGLGPSRFILNWTGEAKLGPGLAEVLIGLPKIKEKKMG